MKEKRIKDQNLLEKRKKEKMDKANKYLRSGSTQRKRSNSKQRVNKL